MQKCFIRRPATFLDKGKMIFVTITGGDIYLGRQVIIGIDLLKHAKWRKL